MTRETQVLNIDTGFVRMRACALPGISDARVTLHEYKRTGASLVYAPGASGNRIYKLHLATPTQASAFPDQIEPVSARRQRSPPRLRTDPNGPFSWGRILSLGQEQRLLVGLFLSGGVHTSHSRRVGQQVSYGRPS